MLAAEDPKAPYPIASATKLMTYYLAAQKLRLDREVVVAPYDAAPAESLAGLEAGDSLSTRDLLYGLIVASGNDAAATLALAVAGSESDFVSKMNAAADDLGLSETDYADPIGLSSANVSSARDLVDLAVELKDQPLFRKITDTPRITLRSGAEPLRLENRNTLVLDEPFVDGVKTGTTLDAGFVLVGSGRKKGVDLVSAVLGTPDATSRDAATLSLLDFGFSLYRKRTLVELGEGVGSVALADGAGRLKLESAAEVVEVTRDDQRVDVKLEVSTPLEGPIVQGEAVGTAEIRLDGQPVKKVEALAARAVVAPPAADNGGSLPGWAWIVFGVAAAAALLLAGLAVASRRADPL